MQIRALDLSNPDKKRYSLSRAILHMSNPGQYPAEFEQECSRAMADKIGSPARGMYIPMDALVEEKREVQASAGSGANLVATDLEAADFITLLRNQSRVVQLGATVLDDLVGNIAIPRQTGAGTAYWLAESTAPTESDQVFDQVTLSPQILGAQTSYSRRLLLQSTPRIDNLVRTDMAKIIAIALDLAAVNGTGASNQPTGILKTSGIGSVALGTNGAAPTWDSVTQLVETLGTANALFGSLGFLGNAQVQGTLSRTLKVSGYPVYIMDDPNELAGYKFASSQNVPANLTKGTGTNLSALIFGNWADVLIGEWGALDILVDPFTNASGAIINLTAFQACNVALRHVASFAAITDMVTT